MKLTLDYSGFLVKIRYIIMKTWQTNKQNHNEVKFKVSCAV